MPDLLLVSVLRYCCVFLVRAGELTATQVLLVSPMALSPESHAKRARTFSIHRVCTRYALSRCLMGYLSSEFSVVDENKSFSDVSSMSVGNHVASCLSFEISCSPSPLFSL